MKQNKEDKLKFEYKISDWESFKKAYLQHNNLLSNSKIEFQKLDEEIVSISTEEVDFNNWHLAELARFYGANLFRKSNEIKLIEVEESNFEFEKSERSQTIIVPNKWNKLLQFNTFYLNCAEAYQTNILTNSLSKSGIEQLNENYPELKLTKASFKSSNKYAYQIIDNILIIMNYDQSSQKVKIGYMYKIEWHEK